MEDVLTNTLSGYKKTSVHIIELEERYAIEGYLLGKKIKVRVSDEDVLSIVFPTITRTNSGYDVGMPGMLRVYGVDIDNWGKINGYFSISNIDTVDAWISGMLVICYAKAGGGLYSATVQKQARKVLHALQIINPDAIRIISDDVPNDLCQIKVSVVISDRGETQPEIRVEALYDDRREKISFADIKLAIKNAEKTISLPYEMIDHARINLSHNDSRATVLNCATAIEIMLKQKLIEYLDKEKVNRCVKEYVIKQADGYSKIVELFKKFSISHENLSNIKEVIIDKRNRIIHGGYKPSYDEASQAYFRTKKALADFKIKMFV